MGLGKTLQAIATSEVMSQLFGVNRVLIVCPTSLKHQWQREIEKFVGRPTEVINGFRTRREKGYATDTFFKITNYDVIYRDLDMIRDWAPDLVILDEAQRIKNWSTRTARSVKQIPSPYALVLTGTPLENRLEELISIVQFVDLYRLGPTYKLLTEHQVTDEYGKVVEYRQLDKIGETLKPIMVRRKKEQVLEQLPERIDSNIFVPMTVKQIHLHDENKEIIARIVERWKRLRFLSETDKQKLMDPSCRVFLSTDAGGTGLNLQHASVVINVDLPLNPAVLEQRIGRVHRLGQNRTVRVVNFVTQGSIEEGMLSVLKFKKSLFTGVLDSGEKEVFLGGSRLNRFMEQVEAATTSIPESLLEDVEAAYRAETGPENTSEDRPQSRPTGRKRTDRGSARRQPTTAVVPNDAPPPPANPWGSLLTAGMTLLQQLAAPSDNGTAQPATAARVLRDEQTGETFLKVPVPSPDVLEQALKAIRSLLEGLRK
jgi:SNF2 family DNA or RNA helicase